MIYYLVLLCDINKSILKLKMEDYFKHLDDIEDIDDIDDIGCMVYDSTICEFEFNNCFGDSLTQDETEYEHTNYLPIIPNLNITQIKSNTYGFDDALLNDPKVIELASLFCSNKVALEHAKHIIKCDMENKQRVKHIIKIKPKQIIPHHLKDEKYYHRRTANTNAVRQYRKRFKNKRAIQMAPLMDCINTHSHHKSHI